MEITALIVLCIITALLALSLRGQRPEFAMLLSLGCGLFVLLYLFFLLENRSEYNQRFSA